jgi:hypothetical protein
MTSRNAYREEFVNFVDQVFSTPSFAIYQQDVQKLLTLVLKCQLEGEKEWYAAKFDPLSQYCGYMLAKMSFDCRINFEGAPGWLKERPDWLMALAGFLDEPGDKHVQQKEVFEKINGEASRLQKKYGPDSRMTLPPPPGEEN